MHDTEVSAQYAWSIMQTYLKCVRINVLINAQTSQKISANNPKGRQ